MRLLLSGERGLFAGVTTNLGVGDRVVVGRSRFTSFSACATPLARRIGRGALEKSPEFRKMSRRHFEVAFEAADRVVIRDLSQNGILIDGRRVLLANLKPGDLARRAAVVRFGANEVIRVSAEAG